MRPTSLIALAFSVAATIAWRPVTVEIETTAQDAFAVHVLPVDSPAGPNSGQPQLSVSTRGAPPARGTELRVRTAVAQLPRLSVPGRTNDKD
jgi:hypothetical protein